MRRLQVAIPDTGTRSLVLLPAGVVLLGWLAWTLANGGYFEDAWYPSAAVAVMLLAVTLLAGVPALPSQRPARVALCAFAALVALNYLSILWADSPADALQASNKLLLYLAVAWVMAILPWSTRTVRLLLAAWVLGVTFVCAAALISSLSAQNLGSYFEDLRFADPMHYPNATAALAAMGVWPALVMFTRRGASAWFAVPAAAVSVFLVAFTFLPQSRGALLALVLTAPVALGLSANRRRLAGGIISTGLLAAVTVPVSLRVDEAASAGRHVLPALQHAAELILAASVAGAVLAGVWLVLERRLLTRGRSYHLQIGPRTKRSLGILIAAVALGLIAANASALADYASREWTATVNGSGGSGPRLASTQSPWRKDYARVALRLFTEHPVLGVGAGNFGRHYDALRRFPLQSRYTHDLTLRVLSETGLAGLGLFLLFLIALVLALIRAARRSGELGRACALASLCMAAYFLVHASLDWLDEFPALAAPAVAFPLVAIVMTDDGSRALPRAKPRFALGPIPGRWLAGTGAAALYLAAVIALVPAYLALRYTEHASASFRYRPTGALADLHHATSLNPLSAQPLITEGTIEMALGRPPLARAAFLRAVRREPNWNSYLQLSLLAAQEGRFAEASRYLSQATELDSDDPVIAAAQEDIAHRVRVNPATVNNVALQSYPLAPLRPVRP